MTEKEIDEQSTPEERHAADRYKRFQEAARMGYSISEGEMLELSQIVGILGTRNKRLGLTK